MRVNELVNSFEDLFASSSRGEGTRKQGPASPQPNGKQDYPGRNNQINNDETRELDTLSEIESDDHSSKMPDEARIATGDNEKEQSSQEGPNDVTSEDQKPVYMIISNSSELTDEVNVEMRTRVAEKSSTDEQESRQDQQYRESTAPVAEPAATSSPTAIESGTVTGIVFEDTNGNGIKDPDEDGVEGVVVVITDSNRNPQTVTTDSNGEYSAVVPPGQTIIDIDENTLPAGATQTIRKSSSDSSMRSRHSELTDEANIDAIEKEFEEIQDRNLDESQTENEKQAPDADDQEVSSKNDSSKYDLSSRVSYPDTNEMAGENHDPEQLCAVHQYTKDSMQHIFPESRDTSQSTNLEIARLSELANETCGTMVLRRSTRNNELISQHESLRESLPLPEPGVKTSKHAEVTGHHDVEEATLADNDLILPRHQNSDDKKLHELLKKMEDSMNERFRHLEDTCDQIPFIMEQLQRQVIATKQTDSVVVITKRRDQSASRNLQDAEVSVPRTDEILNITSTESMETDVSILDTFPELRAYVHQLESTSTNAIAGVLLEESEKADVDILIEATPFDEALGLSRESSAPSLSASTPSSEMSESNATEMLSKEIASLTRDTENFKQHDDALLSVSASMHSSERSESDEDDDDDDEKDSKEIEVILKDADHNDQPDPLDSVLSNCSSILAAEVLQSDPSEALHQVVSFLDEQHASLDRVCWGLICGHHDNTL